MKISINEIFKSIQGEGVYTGHPSVFVRLNGCNLRCAFANGSICDTAYTSWDPEKVNSKTIKEVSNEILPLLDNCEHIVFTGGEPLLQQKALIELINEINKYKDDIVYTIETNGSIDVQDEMYELINLFSVSPKLKNSCCFEGTNISKKLQEKHNKERFNALNIYHICMNAVFTQLKFVYSNDESENDIKEFFSDLKKEWDENGLDTSWFIYNEKDLLKSGNLIEILIMPEGTNEEEMKKSAQSAINACIKNGWRYCHRVHISVWGNKRGV